MSSFTIIALSVICSLISISLAIPTAYDQRQDGGLNVAAKFQNIMVVVAIPSSSGTKPSLVDNSDLASYLTLLSDQANPSPTHFDVTADSHDSLKVDSHEEDDATELFSGDDDSSEVVQQPSKSPVNKVKKGEKPARVARPKTSRTLWSQVEDVVDNREGASLKKELSWGQDEDAVPTVGEDDQSRTNDHNEVGLIPTSRLTLLGSAIEDCGPERRRNSYGICQPFPTE